MHKIGVLHKDTACYYNGRRIYIGVDFTTYEEYYHNLNGKDIIIMSKELFKHYINKFNITTTIYGYEKVNYWDIMLNIERKRIHKNIDKSLSTNQYPSCEYYRMEIEFERKLRDFFWKLYTWEYSDKLKYRKT